MTNKILYFPYINIPNNSWTVKSILYWDEVAAITPQSYIQNTDNLSDFMKEVLQNELVKQIFPWDIDSREVDFENFERMLKNSSVCLDEKRTLFLQGNNVIKIHREKFCYQIFNFLEQQNVAKEEGKYSDWYFVEKGIASLMMLYLATKLSEANGYTPTTDKQENIPLKFKSDSLNITTDEIRSQILTEILPYPESPDFSTIANFKSKYKSELTSFRHAIESLTFNLASEKNSKIRRDRMESEIYLINQERDRLVELLKEHKFIKVLKGSIWGVGVDAFATMVTGEIVTLGAGTAIGFVKSLSENYKSAPAKNEKYAYLALLDQKIK